MKKCVPFVLVALNLTWSIALLRQSHYDGPVAETGKPRLQSLRHIHPPKPALSRSEQSAATTPTVSPPQQQLQPSRSSTPASAAFHWRHLESSDYSTYIANLKRVGCPEQTVRDIIFADVCAHFHAQRLAGIGTRSAERDVLKALGIELPAWASAMAAESNQPGPAAISRKDGAVASRIRNLVLERASLLGSAGDRELEPHEQEMLRRLDLEREEILSRDLNPEEREQIEDEFSPTASSLRDSLGNIELAPDEFRSLHRLRRQFELELAGPQQSSMLAALEAETERLLGPERFEQFRGLAIPARPVQ